MKRALKFGADGKRGMGAGTAVLAARAEGEVSQK